MCVLNVCSVGGCGVELPLCNADETYTSSGSDGAGVYGVCSHGPTGFGWRSHTPKRCRAGWTLQRATGMCRKDCAAPPVLPLPDLTFRRVWLEQPKTVTVGSVRRYRAYYACYDVVNIGSAVRIAKNFGIELVRLVQPAIFDAWRIEGIAHSTADVIERITIHDTLAAAIADCHWTVALSRRLLGKHPNLYMSLRLTPGRAPQNHPLTPFREIKPEWLSLLQDFPDRFVIGGDQFIASPAIRGRGPGMAFAQMSPIVRERTRAFLNALPPDLARKIGYENAVRLYKLKD
jgi:hypothetical protein